MMNRDIPPLGPARRLARAAAGLASAALFFASSSAPAQQAGEVLNAGIKAYQLGDAAGAYKILKRAQAVADTDEVRATIFIYLGMVYLSWDQKPMAAESIAQAAALDPAMTLSPAQFPPDVIALFERSRPAGVGTLALSVTPSGAQAQMDGRPLDRFEGRALPAPEGKRQITIAKSGYRTKTVTVEIEQWRRTELAVELLPATEPMTVTISAPASVQVGGALAVTAQASGGGGVRKFALRHRLAGAAEYSETAMAPKPGGGWEAAALLEGAKAGDMVEFYAAAEDAYGDVAGAGSPGKPYRIPVVAADKTPPVIEHKPPVLAPDGAVAQLTARAVDDVGVASFKIYLMAMDEEKFTAADMTPSGGQGGYFFNIPGRMLEAEEILYYLMAVDQAGNYRLLGGEDDPISLRPARTKPRREALVTQRDAEGGKPGRRVTLSAPTAGGYSKGSRLFAINLESKPSPGGGPAQVMQQLAGEIIVTVVGQTFMEGEVVREFYSGAVRKGTLARMRPSPPSDPSAASPAVEEVAVTWKTSPEPEAQGYTIYRASRLAGPYSMVAKIEGRENTVFKDTGSAGARLGGGARYFYRIKAFNSSGALSDFSATASAVVKGGPNPPSLLEGHSGLARKVRLTWSPSMSTGVAGYRVYRAETENGEYALVEEMPEPAAEEFSDYDAPQEGRLFEEGKRYWYKVQSYDSLGRTGEYTPAVSAASMGKPPAPQYARVENLAAGSVTLAWAPVQAPGIAGYRVYRSASQDGVFEMVAEVADPSAAHYMDKSSPENPVRPDIDYYYKVTAVNGSGAESDFSPAVVAAAKKPLQPPSHLRATVDIKGAIALSWTPSADGAVDGYMIFRGSSPQTAQRLKAVPGRETAHFEDSGPDGKGLPPGAEYYYSVRSLTQEGEEGEAGEWARGATKAMPPLPENIRAWVEKSGAVLVEWGQGKNGEVSGYRVLRSTGGKEFAEIAVVTGNYYRDTDPAPHGAARIYKVQPLDMDSAPGEMSAPALPEPKKAPSQPSGLLAAPGVVSVALAWTPPPERDIRGYEIHLMKDGAWARIGFSTQPMWLVEDLAPDTEYEFAVLAVDNDGQSGALSAPARVRTLK